MKEQMLKGDNLERKKNQEEQMEIEKHMRLSRNGNANAGLHPGILPYVCMKASVQDVYAAEYIK